MKKALFPLTVLCMLLPVCAMAQNASDDEQSKSFSFELSDEGISTSYLWRGQEACGLNAQGDLSLNWEKNDFCAFAGTWYIYGFQESIYGPFKTNAGQEWDLYLGLGYKGFTLTLSDDMSTPYFSKGTYKAEIGDGVYEDIETDNRTLKGDGHVIEASLEYYISDDIPLTLVWNTAIAGGGDVEMDETGNTYHRSFSTYIEAFYDFNIGNLPVDFTASAGFIPWMSPYIDDVEGAHVAWLGLRAGYDVPIYESHTLPISLTAGFNPTAATFLWSFAIGF